MVKISFWSSSIGLELCGQQAPTGRMELWPTGRMELWTFLILFYVCNVFVILFLIYFIGGCISNSSFMY